MAGDRAAAVRSRPAGRPSNVPPYANGGDSPAWSPQAAALRAAPTPSRGRAGRCPTPSCTATRTSASSTAPPTPRSWSRRPSASGLEALALTDHDGFYGVVRFAEAARERRPAHRVRRRAVASGSPQPQNGVADPEGDHLLVLARDPAGLRPAGPGDQRRPRWRAEKGKPGLRPGRAGRPRPRRATGWCSPAAARARCPPRSAADGPAAAARALADLVDAVRSRATWPSSCGTTATRSTRPATTPWPSWPSGPGSTSVATNNVHYATPGPPAAGHRAGRGAGPAQPRRDRRLAAGRRPPPTCARAPSRPAASPATPAWSSGPPSSASSCAFDLRLVAPNLPPFPCPDGLDEMALPAPAHRGGRAPAATGPAPARAGAGRLRADRPRARPHRAARLPRLLPRRVGHRRVLPAGRHLLPGPGVGRQLGGLLRPRHHQRRRGGARPAVRALPVTRARRPARHRHRHRERPARGGHPVRLRALRPRARRPGGQRHHLPGQVGGARHGQGARLRHRPAGRLVEAGRRAGARCAATAGQPDTRHPAGRCSSWPAQVEHFPRHLGIHSGGMVHLRPAGGRGVPGRVGPHGGPQRPAVGQGRLRGGRPGEVRPARPRDAHRRCTTPSTSIREHHGDEVDLATIPQDDAVYDMLCRADSVGVFQVESRAQMATLPRLGPARFYDLVVEVALIRPGPIQGGSVHPYIRRRNGQEPVTYLHPLLETGAGEDARRAAVPGAAHADGHRRGRLHRRRGRPAAPGHGLEAQPASGWSGCGPGSTRAWPSDGITGEVADAIWEKLAAFANYGFPESHSVSFAYLVYAVVVDQALLPGRVLRGAAQRPADGLLLAALAGAGRPPPRRRGPHPRPQRLRRRRRHPRDSTPRTATGRRVETAPPERGGSAGRRCGSASARCGASATTWPSAIAAGRPYARHGGPRPAHAALTLAAARGAGHRRGVRLLRARPAGGAVGGRGGGPVPARPAGRRGHRGRRPRPAGHDRAEEAAADLWATGVSPDGHPTRFVRDRARPRSGWSPPPACAAVADGEQGARGRRGHPPPAAGHRRRHHVRQPRGRDRPDQRDRARRAAGPATAGWPARRRRCWCGAGSRRPRA